MFGIVAPRWRQRDLVAIAVEFRTTDTFDFDRPDGINDPFEALGYVQAHAKSLQVDPARIIENGGSGGGYVTAALSTLERKKPGLPVAAVILNGAMDMTKNSHSSTILMAYKDADPARRAAMSPILHVDANDAPMIQFHGTADEAAAWTEARDFNDALMKHGVHSEFHSYGGKVHGFWNGSYKPGESDEIFNEVMGIAMRFLRELDIVE